MPEDDSEFLKPPKYDISVVIIVEILTKLQKGRLPSYHSSAIHLQSSTHL